MIKKSDIVREAVQKQDWKKALQIAKDFRIGVTQEQRSKMTRAYECIVHPDFYQQIGVDILEAIEQGKAIVKEYADSTRRKNTMMKWDVKHDRAKRVIDAFLENAGYWQEREDLAEDLTDEEKELVDEELHLMIQSIRKRYKLQVRLPEQPVVQSEKKEPELVPMPGIERLSELKEEYTKKETEDPAEKPKRGRKKESATDKAEPKEKKPATRKPRTKKTEKEIKKDE